MFYNVWKSAIPYFRTASRAALLTYWAGLGVGAGGEVLRQLGLHHHHTLDLAHLTDLLAEDLAAHLAHTR